MSLVSDPGPRLDYRGVFGWPVEWRGDSPRLVTGSGISAVVVPRSLSDQVLRGLERQGCAGPALSLPTKHGILVILLAEADVLATDPAALPGGVRVLTAGATIPLPDERRPGGLVHWLVAPDTHQRWLPGLAAVLASIRSACRFHSDLDRRWELA